MNITEKIEALEAQLKELKQELNKPAFEVGKWYLSKESERYYETLINFQGYDCGGLIKGYGFVDKEFKDDRRVSNHNFTPATDKEVEEALIKEAIKQKLIDGTWVKCLVKGINEKVGDNFWVNEDGSFWTNGYSKNVCLMKDGKWATIIKEQPITIGGYPVLRVDDVYSIGCKKINTCGILDIRQFMKTQGFKKVAFDGIETDLETIEKILKL